MFRGSYAAFWWFLMLQSVLRGSENGYWVTDLKLNSPIANYLPRETVPLKVCLCGSWWQLHVASNLGTTMHWNSASASSTQWLSYFTHLKSKKKVWRHDATLFVYFFYNLVHTFIQSHLLSILIRRHIHRGFSSSPHRQIAQLEKPPWDAKPRFEPGPD
jgi:hypothetical protein